MVILKSLLPLLAAISFSDAITIWKWLIQLCFHPQSKLQAWIMWILLKKQQGIVI